MGPEVHDVRDLVEGSLEADSMEEDFVKPVQQRG
jgi:hypothetical protein